MTAEIEILDAAALTRLPPPTGTAADVARRYAAALVRHGARHFVDNADVEARVLVVGGRALPLVLSAGARGNSPACSPHVHYVRYVPEEQSSSDSSAA